MRHDLIYILNAHCLNEWILNLTFQHAACLKKDFCTVIDMFISIINHMSRSISSNFSFLQLALSKISIMKYQPQEILSIDMSLAPVCFYLMIQQVGCQQQELTTKVALRTTKKMIQLQKYMIQQGSIILSENIWNNTNPISWNHHNQNQVTQIYICNERKPHVVNVIVNISWQERWLSKEKMQFS